MLILTKEDGNQVRIVESEKAMTETLFKPIDGKHTADGYLLPATRRERRFMVGNRLYCANIHGCLIKGTETEPGKIFWQHQIDFDYKSSRVLVDALTVERDHLGRIYK